VIYIFFNLQIFSYDKVFNIFWGDALNFLTMGPSCVCIIFLIVKMLKAHFLENEKKKIIVQENARAEFQLLKAQIQPHFLFNTLNNIYFFILNKSPNAKYLVKKLEVILQYMINECKEALVPLDKEIIIINDYIDIEKVRYGDNLDIQIEITGNYYNKIIAPLFLIPFVENSFKHGTSQVLRSPWIKLFIQVDEDILHLTLANSKPAEETINKKKGIGLINVKKRLKLLYPENHYLQIESTEHTFTVNMQIPLEQRNNIIETIYD